MFNKQMQALLNANELALDAVRTRQRNEHDISERRWEYVSGELKHTRKLAEDAAREQTIELAHVDAPNIKVRVTLAEVVQALSDHLNLGMVPEADAEIVVLDVS